MRSQKCEKNKTATHTYIMSKIEPTESFFGGLEGERGEDFGVGAGGVTGVIGVMGVMGGEVGGSVGGEMGVIGGVMGSVIGGSVSGMI